jgi:hypothetical protein
LTVPDLSVFGRWTRACAAMEAMTEAQNGPAQAFERRRTKD